MVASITVLVSVEITSLVIRIAVVSAPAVSVPLLGLRRGVGRNQLLLRVEIEFDFFLACADWAGCKSRRRARASI